MAEDESFERLVAMKNKLKTEIENSEALSLALNKTGSKLKKIQSQMLSLEAETKKETWEFSSLHDSTHHVIAPAAAALRILVSASELEKSLSSSDPRYNLFGYLSITTRLEEVLRFLCSTSKLAAKWLEETVELLANDAIPNDHLYLLRFKEPIRTLHELQVSEAQAHLSGGILSKAFESIKKEFTRILDDQDGLHASERGSLEEILPATKLRKLQAVVQTLKAHDKHLKSCVSTYIKVRTSVVQKRFESLGTEYLKKTITETDNAQDIQGYIEQWRRHVDIMVKDVYEFEHRLCSEVFQPAGTDVSLSCFGKIAADSGILQLLTFGLRISECKKDPVKAMKLLELFSTMDKVRVQFNKLFGGEPCSGIRKVTRELIRRLVNCVSEIFWELPRQVELQRPNSPPPDGRVPRLVIFMTEYCNQLLGNHYRSILTKILEINLSWKQEKYHEELLTFHIYNILKEIAINLDTWSRSYKDPALSCIFMMNNHCYFCRLKETHLGTMMGDSWLRAHEHYRGYYGALYVKQSWGKLLPLLSHKTQVVAASPAKRKQARESIKRTLQTFVESFDQIYMKQASWVVEDEKSRWKVCQAAVRTVVPAYKGYLQNSMMLLVEDDNLSPGEYIKYMSKDLESKLNTMLQGSKKESYRHSHFVHKVVNSNINQTTHLTLTAI